MKYRPELVLVPTFTKTQIEALIDPAFAVDRKGDIIVWNAAATALLGWHAASAVGSGCAALLGGRTLDGEECKTGCPRATDQDCADSNCSAHPNLRVRAIDGVAIPRLERCIAALHGIGPAPRAQPLSVSAGVTEVHLDDRLEDVVARADIALYQAKQKRATICVAPAQNVGAA